MTRDKRQNSNADRLHANNKVNKKKRKPDREHEQMTREGKGDVRRRFGRKSGFRRRFSLLFSLSEHWPLVKVGARGRYVCTREGQNKAIDGS
jgi:hypothetical protein